MKAILRDVPAEFETPRLLVRCPRPGDGRMVYEGVIETLDELRRWPASLPWAVPQPDVESSEEFCRQGQADYLSRKAFPMLLIERASGAYVGGSGLHNVEWSVPSCEVGYWCRKQFQRKGLTTEAVRAVTQFALSTLGMRRIVSLPDAENRPSCLVAERAGYALEGVLHNERKAPDGTLRSTCLYAVTR